MRSGLPGQIIEAPAVIVVGSQAILGTYSEADLPAEATMSMEIDILPIADDKEEVIRLGDLIEGAAGELSAFEGTRGFSIDGVDLSTSALPEGWRERLVKVQNANTAALSGEPEFTGWCLEKYDLCVAKLCAFREKDRNFVGALLDAELVDAEVGVAELALDHVHRDALARHLDRVGVAELMRGKAATDSCPNRDPVHLLARRHTGPCWTPAPPAS